MPGTCGHAFEQAPERPRPSVRAVAVIGVDVLADQRDLAHAGVRQPRDLGDDLHDRARHLGAARIGHDAEGAELVAAFLHGHEGRDAARARRRAARRRQQIELVLDRELGVDHAFAAPNARQQSRQPMVALRPDHEIDRRRAADDLLAFRLGDAAGDRDHHAAAVAGGGLLEHAHAAELGIDLLGRLLADVAGVEDDEIGVLGRGGLGKTLGRERVRHTMGIVDVHLAAERLDMDFARSVHAGPVNRASEAVGRHQLIDAPYKSRSTGAWPSATS